MYVDIFVNLTMFLLIIRRHADFIGQAGHSHMLFIHALSNVLSLSSPNIKL